MSLEADHLRTLAAKLDLSLISPEAVVAEATALLERVPDCVSLTALAGATPTAAAVHDLLTEALRDLGASRPTSEEAGRIVARETAAAIVNGLIGPYEGARYIWARVARAVPALEPELRRFIGLASEYEDDVAHVAEIEDDIRRAALEILA